MKAVTTRNEIASYLSLLASIRKTNLRGRRVQIVNSDALGLKHNLSPRFQPRSDQVFNNFVLAIDSDGAPREIGEVDAVATSAKTQFHTTMDQTFSLHPLTDAHAGQKFDGTLFEHAGTDSPLTIFPVANFEDYGIDTLKV